MRKIIIDISGIAQCNFVTGIQRVVCEYVKALFACKTDLTLVYYDCQSARFIVIPKTVFLKIYNSKEFNFTKYHESFLLLSKLNNSYIWYDMDCIWGNSAKRNYLYPLLKKQKVSIVCFIHDLFPISHPQFLDDNSKRLFLIFISAVFDYADKIITSSLYCKNQINYYLTKCKIKKTIDVVPLGSDIKTSNSISENIITICKQKYILVVGTICKRKNQSIIFDSFLKYLTKHDINLIFVGRVREDSEEIIQSIKRNKLFNKRVYFIENCKNGSDLVYLYKHAFCLLVASQAEGFCIPIVEALRVGCPCFTSDLNVFKEVSHNLNKVFENIDAESISKLIIYYLENDNQYKLLRKQIKNEQFNSWEESTNKLLEKLYI